ncbi:tafazzin [Schistocerca piceifrons]|uniref:tafazzin n=1 Tax=Schistocerca piceifrons TaxID=274613 RepID=UPI001F5FD1B7|nr:tafazzin [Schistocerca piceifrons]XP_049788109.1 tafazzin [Schistocerca cancellata]XP_049963751.1 tafazzin [Schistocerca serialis cubense]
MCCDVDWVFPALRKPSRLWNVASTVTLSAVGMFSKLITEWLNTTKVYNRDILIHALENRPPTVPLITVSNHHSCFDDPGLWGCLGLKHLLNREIMRWSLAAHDICFTNMFHSYFFMLGKCVPVVRGKGVYQQALDFCLEQLSKGNWIHVFPEGRVNMAKEYMRLKWGIGRLIYECPKLPLVIPMCHIGMDNILPNTPPYILRMGKKVTLNFGKPIDFRNMLHGLRESNVPPQEARKVITDKIENTLMLLKAETERLHLITLQS